MNPGLRSRGLVNADWSSYCEVSQFRTGGEPWSNIMSSGEVMNPNLGSRGLVNIDLSSGGVVN